MEVIPTSLPEVVLLKPKRFADARGYFMETYNERFMAAHSLPVHWCQDNFSFSTRNVVRGLHYQVIQPQHKLVRVLSGAVWDVAVDVRRGSPTFGKHVALELTAEHGLMLYIPAGFAHGFAALTDEVQFAYKVTDYYCAPGERTILWDDPSIGIEWPISAEAAVVSDKDRKGSCLHDAEVFTFPVDGASASTCAEPLAV